MAETIITKSSKRIEPELPEANQVKDKDGNITGSQVHTESPEVLKAQNLQELVNQVGEQMVYDKCMAQLVIDFRAMVRSQLESQSDGEWTKSVEDVQNASYSDWTPVQRQRKSKEEKLAESLSKLSADEVKAALAKAGLDL